VILSAKEVELLSIGFDASHTDMYAPEMRRHIRKSLAAGVAVEEIMEVLKLCLLQGRPGLQSRHADPRRRDLVPAWPVRCRP